MLFLAILSITYTWKWFITEQKFGKGSKQEKEMAQDQDANSQFPDTWHKLTMLLGTIPSRMCWTLDFFDVVLLIFLLQKLLYNIKIFPRNKCLIMKYLWIIYHPKRDKRLIALNSNNVQIHWELNDSIFLQLKSHKTTSLPLNEDV